MTATPRRISTALVALISLAHAAGWAAWCLVRDPGAAHDDANLYLWAVDLSAWLTAGAPGGLPENVRGAPYPPGLPLLAAAHFRALGAQTVGLACASAWPLIAALCGTTAWSAGRAWGPWAGLAAAALAPLPLWSLGHPGSFHADLALGCAVGATTMAAAAPGGWGLRRALGVGLLAATALLLKWTAALLLVPLALAGLGTRRRGGVLLAGLVCAAAAAPWYVPELPRVLAFTQDNLAGDFTGEAAGLALAWSFYPSRLVTGVWGTPLLLLTLVGAAWARRGPHRAALLALAAGVALLTLQPYRDQRYLLAGLGLVAPLTVAGAQALAGRVGQAAVLTVGLALGLSWLDPLEESAPEGDGWVHHRVEDRDGLRRAGLRQARRDLWAPRLRLRGPLPDPVQAPPPLRRAARALHRHAPPGPLTVHVVDTVGRSVLERLKVELAAVRGPGVQISRSPDREAALLEQVAGRDVAGWLPPARLADRAWVVESLDPDALAPVRPAWEALRRQGRVVVYRGGAPTGARPAVVQVWSPPGWQSGSNAASGRPGRRPD